MFPIAPCNLWDVNVYTSNNDLGQKCLFNTWDPTTGAFAHYPQSKIVAQLVKNLSGGTLSAGAVVLHNSDDIGPGMAVEGAATAGSIGAGVVPWFLTNGVASGETFWLIKQGFCKFLSDGGNDVAAGVLVITGGTGYVSAHTQGTDDDAVCGIMIEAIGSSAGAKKKAIADFRF